MISRFGFVFEHLIFSSYEILYHHILLSDWIYYKPEKLHLHRPYFIHTLELRSLDAFKLLVQSCEHNLLGFISRLNLAAPSKNFHYSHKTAPIKLFKAVLHVITCLLALNFGDSLPLLGWF